MAIRTSTGIVAAAGLGLVAIGICVVLVVSRTPASPPAASPVAVAGAGETKPPDVPVAVPAADPKGPAKVYDADFDAGAGDEWSIKTVTKTPTGRVYLGTFLPRQRPALTITSLPAHQMIKLTFDLFLTRSWDGSSAAYGAAIFDVFLDDQRSLLHTTFGNCGFFRDNNEQAFPDNYPATPYPAFTLSKEHQTLGVMQSWSGREFDTSSVYHMVMAFPHTAASVVVNFKSDIKDVSSKGYGLTNVHVEALPQVNSFTPEQFTKLWADLGSGAPDVFYKARWSLVSGGDAAADFIGQHLDEKIDLTTGQMQQLAKDMEDTDARKAEDALYQLKFQGAKALPIIMPVAQANPEEFVGLAPRQVRRYPAAASESRLQRAAVVLEAIHTARALEVKGKIPNVAPIKLPGAVVPAANQLP